MTTFNFATWDPLGSTGSLLNPIDATIDSDGNIDTGGDINADGDITADNLSGTNTGDQTIANSGTGNSLVKTGSGSALVLKGLVEGANITLTPSTDGITIAASGGGSGITDLTGDVTATGPGSVAATIANDAVTYAKMQNASANTVIARAANSSGNLGEVALAASQLLGRGDSGDIAAITLGTNLSFSGTTLNAAGGGGGGMTWTEVTGTTQAMAVDNGYIANNASLVTLTLPDTAAVGKVVAVTGYGAGGWRVAQNAGEQIVTPSGLNTTSGTGGYVQSTSQYCSAFFICAVANTTWVMQLANGSVTIA